LTGWKNWKTGAKGSGLGREGPRYAIEEMSEMRLMVINRAGGID
jgi:acyl-CoA reductase-like NAD-dependent aldehyde dehydrogenase